MSDAAEAPWLKYQKAAPAPAEGPWTRYRSGAGQGAPGADKDATGAPGGDTPSMLGSLWAGLVHGAGNVLHGGARIGARMGEATDTGFGPELPPGTTQRVDETAAKRESTYQASPEKKAHPIVSGIGEVVGETAGVAAEMGPLAAAGPATVPWRLAWNSLLGAGASLATPKGGESMSPGAQAGRAALGAAGGAAGGAVAEAGGSLLSKAIAGNSDQAVIATFRNVIKPGRGGRNSATKLTQQDRQILTAIDDISQNKGSLKFSTPEGGEVAGQLPQSIRQFSEAIDQRKRSIFEKYDALAKGAETAESGAPNRHLTEFTDASRQATAAQKAVAQAEQAVTMATARQSRAGNNVYMTSAANQARSEAQEALEKAQAALARAQRAKAAAKTKAYSVRVDTASAAQQLRAAAADRVVSDFHPDIAVKANKLARNLESEGTLTLTETQDMIAMLNKEMLGFYQTGRSGLGDKLAPVAVTLREQLDHAIESTGAPGYQALKNQYGALKSIEKDVAGAVQREANKIPGGIGARLADYAATTEFIRGIFNPKELVAAVGIKGAQIIMKMINDPNKAIGRLFAMRANTAGPLRQGIGSAIGAARPYLGNAAGVTGGEAAGDLMPQQRELGQFPSMPINP